MSAGLSMGAASAQKKRLGAPRVHLRCTDSTNERARRLALAGAPHGTLVSAAEQTAGRGRQGRAWAAPASSSLLCSLVLRPGPPGCVSPIFDLSPALFSLAAAVAVCDVVGEHAQIKWPNDVVVGPQLAKLAGILSEGRPQEGWVVLGIGVNVALRVDQLPRELHDRAASMELPASAIEQLLEDLLVALTRRLSEQNEALLDAWRTRDALRGREISWRTHGLAEPVDPRTRSASPESGPCEQVPPAHGRALGIDGEGRLLVRLADGTTTALSAGEVHLDRRVESP
jgi:BirA family biotin operon repressor/biotin-[acetyl-CoA-carboxylase] ligase